MATFSLDPVPNDQSWSIQWKNNLSRLRDKLVQWAANPTVSTLTAEDTVVLKGDLYSEGAIVTEEDITAEDAAFSGEVTVGEDVNVGEDLRVEGDLYVGGSLTSASLNSPVQTASVTASGTSIEFIGIPTWVRWIEIIFNGLSLTGTNNVLIQIGNNSAYETTGYDTTSTGSTPGGSVSGSSSTSGFIMAMPSLNNTPSTGYYSLLFETNTNTWYGGGHFINTDVSRNNTSSGYKTFSGLTKLKLIPTAANTFDAGTVTLRYGS